MAVFGFLMSEKNQNTFVCKCANRPFRPRVVILQT